MISSNLFAKPHRYSILRRNFIPIPARFLFQALSFTKLILKFVWWGLVWGKNHKVQTGKPQRTPKPQWEHWTADNNCREIKKVLIQLWVVSLHLAHLYIKLSAQFTIWVLFPAQINENVGYQLPNECYSDTNKNKGLNGNIFPLVKDKTIKKMRKWLHN